MKYILNIIFVLSIALLTSCHKDDSEPAKTPLKIYRQFKTETKTVRLSELESLAGLDDKLCIVNSIEELPDDPFFGTEEFQRAAINFSEYSLIIKYHFVFGDVTGYEYGWYYNNWFLRYEFHITYDIIKDSEYVDGEIDLAIYVRSAILVRHIPSDSRCATCYSENYK